MKHNSQVRSRRRRVRVRQFFAPAAALVVAAALAACGSSTSSTSSSAGASTTVSGAASGGVATAEAALKQWEAAPTKINITTPLKSAPPAGKTVVFLGTNQPQVTLVGQTMATLAALAHWNYSTVTYDPANPATFTSAVETALTKHANYIAETGTPN